MSKQNRNKNRAAATEADTPMEQLPTFDGTQLDMGIWLRQLLNCVHLLPSDLAYYAITGAHATRDHKTVVLSLKHGILLKSGYIHSQNFTITNPPPNEDNYDALYAKALAEGATVPAAPTDADLT